LDIVASKDVALGDARGMYDLVKDNMHDMYVEAGWGWDAAEKWREMEHRDARFLIARWCRGGSGRLAGFCHFRFAWDEDENEDGEGVGGKEDVLYVYELQVAPRAKRRGLGRRMMQALE
ncbi:unnamed protein product, partial [Laminaria digitata]